MLRVGFEPTILAFERAKAYRVLERAVTVIGKLYSYIVKYTRGKLTECKFLIKIN
jgi:hypothetical protein